MAGLLLHQGLLKTGHQQCQHLLDLPQRPTHRWQHGRLRCRAQSEQEIREAMKDPQVRAKMKEMQEAMQRPEVQQQMQQMTSLFQNKEMMAKMQALENDPELAPKFQEMRKGGMASMMKFMNDPAFLVKIGKKMGPMPSGAEEQFFDAARSPAAPQPAAQAAAPAAPAAINTLLDAARYGDVEATEDFIAIGRDVNDGDEGGRTPLHYAIAYKHFQVMETLLAAGARLDTVDMKENTPLHYAAGYAVPEFVKRLVHAGASKAAKNDSNNTPYDLIVDEERNPLNNDRETLDLLRP